MVLFDERDRLGGHLTIAALMRATPGIQVIGDAVVPHRVRHAIAEGRAAVRGCTESW
jgi:hypothetical protein